MTTSKRAAQVGAATHSLHVRLSTTAEAKPGIYLPLQRVVFSHIDNDRHLHEYQLRSQQLGLLPSGHRRSS